MIRALLWGVSFLCFSGRSTLGAAKRNTPPKVVELRVTRVKVSANSLKIRAQLINRSKESVYYVDILTGGSDNNGRPIKYGADAYRIVRDHRAVLIRSFIPVPEDVALEVVRYPMFAILKAGESVVINLNVALPSHPDTPYHFEPFNSKTAHLRQLPWSLEIGWVDKKTFMAEKPTKVMTANGESGYQVHSLDEKAIRSVRYDSDTMIPILVTPKR
jgi:hypothetical protein